MPLSEDDVPAVRKRIYSMYMYTNETMRILGAQAPELFGQNGEQMQLAIAEYLQDFIDETHVSGEINPEQAIFEATRESLQTAGFYGAQLDVKERQVLAVNERLQRALSDGPIRRLFRNPFKDWIDVVNNFASSIANTVGIGEALKELKDSLRDELPDDDED